MSQATPSSLTLKVLSLTKSIIQATSSWQSRSCFWPSLWPRPHHPDCLDLVCDKGHVQGDISLTLEDLTVAKAMATASWLSTSCLWLRSWPWTHHPHTRGFVCGQGRDPGYIILTVKVLSVTMSMDQATSSLHSRSCLWPRLWSRLHFPDSLDLVCDKLHDPWYIVLTV